VARDWRRHEAGEYAGAQMRPSKKTAMHGGERKGMSTTLSKIMSNAAARVSEAARGKRKRKNFQLYSGVW
jgi:hypothetical protein